MADVSKIKLPSGTTYNIKDDNALPLTGGSVTGPVSFGDSVSIDEATIGDLVVNGQTSFVQGIKTNQLVPMQSKTFTGVIGTANNWAGATFFFGSIKPTAWSEYWRIKYKIRVYVPGQPNYNQIADVSDAFEKGFYIQWLSEQINRIPIIQNFRRRVHEQHLERFKKLDCYQYTIAQKRIRKNIISSYPKTDEIAKAGSELGNVTK